MSSFWNELRLDVRDRVTTGDVSTDLFSTICSFDVSPVAVVQPTFFMGRFYILSFDFMDFVEKLLDCPDDSGKVFQLVLYLRETTSTMGRCIRNAAEPVEAMMTFLEIIWDESYPEEDEFDELEEMDHEDHVCGPECSCSQNEEDALDEWKEEREVLSSAIRAKLEKIKVSSVVAPKLAERLADTYAGCVAYVRALRILNSPESQNDISRLMEALVEIQYLLDNTLRRLLLEDVFLQETPAFTTGLMPWMSHTIEELARMVSYPDHFKMKHNSGECESVKVDEK